MFQDGDAWSCKVSERFQLKPWTIHANYVIGMEAKINLLRRADAWYMTAEED
jgi:hypothetical protein